MKKTENILREDGTLFATVDQGDDIELRIKIVRGEITEKLYYENEYGNEYGEIDEYGVAKNYSPFKEQFDLLYQLVKEQMQKRSKNRE